jgi:O-acetyl-ADP-ribose deacetylase (regulator of RNase III)
LAFAVLRRRCARPGQTQLSVRDVANRTGRPASTLHPYLTGKRLCPADVFEDLLRALNVTPSELRPWLDAWDRVADRGERRPLPSPDLDSTGSPPIELLSSTDTFRYRVRTGNDDEAESYLSIVTGDIRHVRGIDAWVNSENTSMEMSRFEDYSISAVIRYEGADVDGFGRVTEDWIARELAAKVAGRAPVAPTTAIVTGAGRLTRRNGVRYVIHVAAVQGEPGAGYRPVVDMGRCVTNALVAAEELGGGDAPVRSVLIPLLGTGVGGGALRPTVARLLGAAINHFGRRSGRVREVVFLASTGPERDACLEAFDAQSRLRRDVSTASGA